MRIAAKIDETEVTLKLAAAGWSVATDACTCAWQSVGFYHVVQVHPAEIPAELAARVRQPLHHVTAAESKRLGAPWCSPIGESRPGWWYLDADGVPQHAGPTEIGEDGARAAAEQGLSTIRGSWRSPTTSTCVRRPSSGAGAPGSVR